MLRMLVLSWRSIRWHRFDWISPVCMTGLLVMSVMFIYSSQVYNSGDLWIKQLIWITLGVVIYFIVSLLDYRIWFEQAHWLYLGAVALLLVVLTPAGTEIYNARRWIDLKFITLQPAEMAKIATLILVARLLSKFHFQTFGETLTSVSVVAGVTLIPTVFIFAQPDLGSALVIPIMTFIILYSAGFHKRFFQISLGLGLLLVSVVGWDLYRYQQFLHENNLSALEDRGAYEPHSWIPLKDYQRNRLMVFIAPDLIDPQGLGDSWNVRQSLISVGTGGWSGKGWTEGTQAKLGYLPQTVAYNDFIFSVIAEESGFVGASSVILLFAILVFNGLRIAQSAHDRFGQLLATGVSVLLFIHAFINMGMTMGIAPVTGLPLPFLSHGGTFLLSCFTLLAFQQSIYRYREKFI
ncbi:MAG: FtsW/RodA/SpoVE family cell cycle protein [Puniceicoccaceae bacterium]